MSDAVTESMSAPEERVSEVEAHFAKLIFPFRFEKRSIRIDQFTKPGRNQKTIAVFERFAPPCENMRSGIDRVLSSDGGRAQIAECYKLNHNARTALGLPKDETDWIRFGPRTGEQYKVLIQNIHVYFFESGIGFLEIECEYDVKSAEEFYECSYFLCELKSDKNVFQIETTAWNPEAQSSETRIEQISLYDFIVNRILDRIVDAQDINQDGTPAYREEKPILFSYVLLKHEPKDIQDLLFHIRQNYKASYKSAKRYADIREDPNVSFSFENSYWGASYTGAANVSYLTDDQTTNSFFTNNFKEKARDSYFFLYLLALHQKYSLIKYAGEMGQLDILENDVRREKEQMKRVEQYQSRAALLKYRSFFQNPSTIAHRNEFYNLVRSVLQVDSLYEDYMQNLALLKDVCIEKERKYDNRTRSLVEIFAFVSVTVLGVFSLWNSWAGVVANFFPFTVPFGFSLGVTLVVGLGFLAYAVVSTKKLVNEYRVAKKDNERSGLKQETTKKRSKNKVQGKCNQPPEEHIDAINKSVEITVNNIDIFLRTGRFNDDPFFEDQVKVFDCKNYSTMEDCKGIYVFKMKKAFECKDVFDDVKYASKRNEPKADCFEKGKILYVGKSNEMKDRAKEHFEGRSESTYSLKMACEERKNKNGEPLSKFVRVFIFRLKESYSDNEKYYKMILPAIEGLLHDELKPLVGSPRT